jgi:hypothetical protein
MLSCVLAVAGVAVDSTTTSRLALGFQIRFARNAEVTVGIEAYSYGYPETLTLPVGEV